MDVPDSGTDAGDAGDGAVPDGGVYCALQATGTNVGTTFGVVTNYPDMQLASATDGVMTLKTLTLGQTSSNDLFAYGEITNTGATPKCFVNIDLAVGGTSLSGLVYGTPHTMVPGPSTLPTDCIPGAATAPFIVLADAASPANYLSVARPVSFDVSDTTLTGPWAAHPYTPTVAFVSAGTQQACGRTVTLSVTTQSAPIYNVAVQVFSRDTRGLLTDLETAYHLEDIAGSTTVQISTLLPLPSHFVRVLVPDFIVRTSSAVAEAPDIALTRARRERRHRELMLGLE